MASNGKHLRVGVDIGGTFTDLIVIDDATGRILAAKVLTTPDDPAGGVLAGLAKVLASDGTEQSQAFEPINTIVHGTTLATNAIIERKGARTALLTTRGFRDILETGKELRYDLYDTAIEFPEPLVSRRLRVPVAERTRYDGQVLEPLDEVETRRAVESLLALGIESLAICFLHAYANPTNERRAAELARELASELPISLSSEVLPEIGEFGRASTTAANAYVQPIVRRYLGHLEQTLTGSGFAGAFFIMSSSGGSLSLPSARDFPVKLVESGPAAGASIASFYAQLAGEDLLGLDMGGTTAKISLVKDGQPARAMDFEVAHVRRFQKGSGLLLKVPAIDLIEIGAGGGSIAHVNQLGLLAVGPESAGAQPGPACYGRGGERPTVTDADLVLGYLNADYFLGGEMRLSPGIASAAIERDVARPLGLSTVEAARSVYEVVNANMANAVSVYTAEKGVDVRDFTLFAFGGAAPAHAWDVARTLHIGRVLVPGSAGVLSALGCILSPISFDFAVGYMRELNRVDWNYLNGAIEAMERQGRELLEQAGVGADDVRVIRTGDMRYLGQRYEVNFVLPAGRLSSADVPIMEEAFYASYREQYGREIREVPVEAVTWRVTVAGPRPEANLRAAGQGVARAASKGRRDVFFSEVGGFVDCAVYDRYALGPGAGFDGPAVVEDRESTAIIPPRARVRVDDWGTLVIELG